MVKSRQVLFCGLVLAFDGHAKSFASNFNAYFRAEFLEFPAHCCSNLPETYLIDEKFLLRSEYYLWSQTKEILISIPCVPCKQQVANSNTVPILVFLLIHPFGCDASSSLGEVYSRQATEWNCERIPQCFSRHEVLSNFNNIQNSCIHAKFAQFVSLW